MCLLESFQGLYPLTIPFCHGENVQHTKASFSINLPLYIQCLYLSSSISSQIVVFITNSCILHISCFTWSNFFRQFWSLTFVLPLSVPQCNSQNVSSDA